MTFDRYRYYLHNSAYSPSVLTVDMHRCDVPGCPTVCQHLVPPLTVQVNFDSFCRENIKHRQTYCMYIITSDVVLLKIHHQQFYNFKF